MIHAALAGLAVAVAVAGTGCDSSGSNKLAAPGPGEREIGAVFGELRARQEQYHMEMGSYLSTGASEAERWPATPTGEPQPLAPLPEAWQTLRVELDRAAVYCAYVVVAGKGADATNIGPVARQFGFTAAPPQDWYYILAECDDDGDAAHNSWYFTASSLGVIEKRDPGR